MNSYDEQSWPSIDHAGAALTLTRDGDEIRVTATYGSGREARAITVALDVAGVRELADLSAVVGDVLATDNPTAGDYQAARGRIAGRSGFVGVHARMLRVHGPAAPAADVFVANQTGNYSVRFRRQEWAEITAALAAHLEGR